MNILAALQGKKTYLTAIAGVATTAAGVAGGQITPTQGLIAALLLTAQAFGRAGSATDANKVIVGVTTAATAAAAAAPIVGALVPGAAKMAGIVGELGAEVAAAAPAA